MYIVNFFVSTHMKKITFLVVLFLLFFDLAKCQIISTVPSIPVATDSVTIIFDASLGTGQLEDYSGDVYAHTGVITDMSVNGSEWRYVVADWGVNVDKAKMKSLGDNKWELKISPDIKSYYGVPDGENILKMAFVFRSATQVGGVWLEGKDVGATDILVPVFEGGLNVLFNYPNNDILVEKDSLIHIDISASGNDSLFLYVDEVLLRAVKSDTLVYDYLASDLGRHQFIALAKNGIESITDTISFFVKDTVINMDLPPGMRDGINRVNDSTACFVLFAPDKNSVFITGDFNDWKMDNDYLMLKDENRYWITVSNLDKQKEYIFQYVIDGEIKIADPYSEKIADPWNDASIDPLIYPDLIAYPFGKTTEIASVFSLGRDDFDWQSNDFVPEEKENLVIYELLIRDFTLEGGIKAVINKLDYLKDMGVNAVELMPFNEFEANDSWGYNPSFYFAPDKAYGTINDYKWFIDECHKREIAVIMDMVLNHSYLQSPLVRMYFENGKPAANNPWYNVNHNFENTQAHWGYDFNHESPHTQALVDSICSYWMKYYRIDGFRFDFTKGFSNTWHPADGPDVWGSNYDASRISLLKRMSDEIRKRNPKAIIIFEHLATNSEEKELAESGILLWGNINHSYSQASMGYSDGFDLSWASYKSRGWNVPNLVTYMESHDEERIMYRNLNYGRSSGDYDIKELNTGLERMELVNAFLLTLPGPKMIWQFGELGYDFSIDYNGRLGKKPVKWEYFDIPERRKLYQTIKAINDLKIGKNAFSSTDFQIDLSSYFKHIQVKGSLFDVCIVGNFDVKGGQVSPMFTKTGRWYDYFNGDSITISSVSETIDLEPGEYKIFTTKSFEVPDRYQAPIAKDIAIVGEAKEGKTLTASYTYFDENGDEEGLSVYSWYRADSSSGSNEVLIDGVNDIEYITGRDDVNKYICFKVVPVAVSGGLLIGKTYKSNYIGPVESALFVYEEDDPSLKLYLNYTEKIIHITVGENIKRIEFVNLLGRKELVVEPDGRTVLEISFNDLNKGYYAVNFITINNRLISRKISIVR